MPVWFQCDGHSPSPSGQASVRRHSLHSTRRSNAVRLAGFMWLFLSGVLCMADGPYVAITRQPSNVVVLLGTPVAFTVAAIGAIPGDDNPPISYQWQQLAPQQTNWMDIPGANQATYTTIFQSCTESGTQLRCFVAVTGASALSDPASVYAFGDDLYPPSIYHQPASQTVLEGCTAQFAVGAFGQVGLPDSSPLTYQWFQNGEPILGATNQTYTTPPVTLRQSGGRVQVVVSNSCGAVISSNAWLTVAGDVFPPAAVCALSLSSTQIVVFYNKPVYGGDLFSYALDQGATVLSARERPGDAFVAELIVSQLTIGADYRLKVSDIADFSGNVIFPNRTQLMFRAQDVPPIAPQILRGTMVCAGLLLEWNQGGVLQAAESLAGPWRDVLPASSPYLVNNTAFGCRSIQNSRHWFYRLKIQP